jgi:hypothetical protein
MARNRYEQIIERIFLAHYERGSKEVVFDRDEITAVANQLGIDIPKNLGDLIYSFRYRIALPTAITSKAPKGKEWIIRPVGRSRYQFVLVVQWAITPNPAQCSRFDVLIDRRFLLQINAHIVIKGAFVESCVRKRGEIRMCSVASQAWIITEQSQDLRSFRS